MTAEHTPEQIARAFDIADEAMFELICSERVTQDTSETPDGYTAWGLVDDAGCEVKTLAEAGEALHEAYDWLKPRGIVELCTDDSGEYIAVVRRPWE